jgi:hypothetical protein
MCDYSLAHFPNRLAVEGEQLVVHRFGPRTLGLAPAKCGLKKCGLKELLMPTYLPAVCVPPGARLRLYDISEDLQRRLGVGAVEEVTFIEQSLEAFTYRDGVRFANGREILLQQLTCGQRAEVMSLGTGEEEPQPSRLRQTIHHVFVG